MGSVKVAVRVRPFNSREIELKSVLCLDMNGPKTIITDPSDGKSRDFTFDYSFWSHDEYKIDEKGYFYPEGDKYADQQKVFEKVGVEILDNAWQGYHCCLFAYGQTGAGKSYSMIGYGSNKGIVPISMQDIFERIKNTQNENLKYEIMFSMLEIYNEKIQDLLIAMKDRPQGGLKVREHQKMGVYVESLSKWPVDSYDAIEAKMDEGNRNRTIGSTMMNASSSRAHTIITIEFKKIDIIDGKKAEKFSVINLVDLAGSEKLAKTGATGDRMKEGCAINQSLTSLGIVISKLAEKSSGKKNVVIPYRDSVLTRILQNALGGNSKTLMICALSPATDNFDETLSTLRYADQAKKIKNNAVINESEQDKMIRELKEENEKLKSMLKDINPGNVKSVMVDEETQKRYKEMEEQLKSNQILMQEMEKTFEQKIEESKMKEKEGAKVNISKPHLMNLNEDPLLTGKVIYSLDRAIVHVGRKNGNPIPDIILGGVGIKSNHARILNQNDDIYVEAVDEECSEYIYVNGERLNNKRKLEHNDRLIFGTNSIFLFKNPSKTRASLSNNNEIDWEFAQKELVDTINRLKKIQIEQSERERQLEMESKIKQVQEVYKKEKEEIESSIKKQQEEYEQKIKEFETKMKKETEAQLLETAKKEAEREWKEAYARYEAERLRKEHERERMQKQIQEEALIKKLREQEKNYLEGALTKYLSRITEVNLIAKELNRNITFSVKLCYIFLSGGDIATYSGVEKAQKMKILVDNKEQNCQYIWRLSKFSNRYYIIKDMLEKYYETGQLPQTNNVNDPFWDPPEPHLIGQGFLTMRHLGYLIDNHAKLVIVGDNGECGNLYVNLIVLNENGEALGNKAEYIQDPQELLNKRLDFGFQIDYGLFPENFCQDTYCEYALMDEDGVKKDFKTSTVPGKDPKPYYEYYQVHTYGKIDQKILHYLLNHYLNIKIYGYEVMPDDNNNKSSDDDDEDGEEATENNDNNNTIVSVNVTNKKLESIPEDEANEDADTKGNKKNLKIIIEDSAESKHDDDFAFDNHQLQRQRPFTVSSHYTKTLAATTTTPSNESNIGANINNNEDTDNQNGVLISQSLNPTPRISNNSSIIQNNRNNGTQSLNPTPKVENMLKKGTTREKEKDKKKKEDCAIFQANGLFYTHTQNPYKLPKRNLIVDKSIIRNNFLEKSKT